MKSYHRSASPYESQIGFSRAVRSGNRILVSGTAPIGPEGKTMEGDAYLQARRCLEIIAEAIEALGGGMGDVVRTRMYLTSLADAEPVWTGARRGLRRCAAGGDDGRREGIARSALASGD